MKLLLSLITVLLCLSVSAQVQPKKEQVTEGKFLKSVETLQKDQRKLINIVTNDTIALLPTAKFVIVDSVAIPVDAIKQFAVAFKQNKLPLYVMPDWIILNYQFIKKAANPGMNDEQMDALKAPLIPYIEYFQRLQQQQAEKQKLKQ